MRFVDFFIEEIVDGLDLFLVVFEGWRFGEQRG